MIAIRHLVIAFALLLAPAHAVWPPAAASLVEQAGNTDDDRERQVALEKLAALDFAARGEATAMADFVRRWNEGGLKAYNAQVKGKGVRAIGDYDFGVAAGSPLRPIAELYRGRMLAWTLIENSNVRTHPVDSRWFKDEAVKSFRRAADAFPRNRVARMYLGEAIPWPREFPAAPGAPAWAVLQREQIERLREIILWWIEHRQRPDGQFGGGWGDDCEMWRWWSAVLLGFDDPVITKAQLKFSKAAVARPHLKGGFNTDITDVEHAAEDTTDNLIPLMVLEPHEPRWEKWALRMGDFMSDVWTGRNERGQLQFKSFYFSATATAPQPERAFDVIANVGALHPSLLAWQRTGDVKLGAQICAWLDMWVDATARAGGGKPAGILPASIRWPDGAVAGAAGKWWEPIKPGGYMHSYYIWPSVITEMTDALMLAHAMTGEEKYLAPLRSMAAIRLKHLGNESAAPPGSDAWCAGQLAPRRNANSNTGGLVKTLARCKALTGTSEFDELLAREGGEFVVRTDAEGRRELVAALRESAAALRVNFPGFTSEVRSTDRCMRFVQFLAQDYAFDEYRGVMQPKHELLYRMVTGDKNAPRFPQMAVRWLTPPEDIAALVTDAGATRFEAELFHFGEKPRPLTADLRSLRPGAYSVQLSGRDLPGELVVERGAPVLVKIELPPQKLSVLRITPKP
ncbi:MAG: hypothetical protein ABMA13_01585 [Chthoniobacteraceae bacterium]